MVISWFDLVHTAMAIATKKSGNETYKVGYSFLKHLFWYIENPSWVVRYTRSQVIKHFLVLVPSSPQKKPKLYYYRNLFLFVGLIELSDLMGSISKLGKLKMWKGEG